MHQRVDMGGRDEPESAHRHNQQTGDDAAFVSQLAGQPPRRHGHQEVAQIVRELHPGGLRFGQAQLLLEVLVHHVDHPVADSPQEKQRADQDEREHQVHAVIAYEEALLVRIHDVETILAKHI